MTSEYAQHDLDTLLALMADPPCDSCGARREVHNTEELFSRHTYVLPTAAGIRELFINVSEYTLPENRKP